jgi:aryl-alcohol dehydrogenase-like predicted oxidoreductase
MARRTGALACHNRIAADSISEHDRSVARAVQDAADELGLTPSQVAIAWTMARSGAVRPILGARRVEQLADNLGALDVTLPPEIRQRLETASAFTAGFPADFIKETEQWVLGKAASARRP